MQISISWMHPKKKRCSTMSPRDMASCPCTAHRIASAIQRLMWNSSERSSKNTEENDLSPISSSRSIRSCKALAVSKAGMKPTFTICTIQRIALSWKNAGRVSLPQTPRRNLGHGFERTEKDACFTLLGGTIWILGATRDSITSWLAGSLGRPRKIQPNFLPSKTPIVLISPK